MLGKRKCEMTGNSENGLDRERVRLADGPDLEGRGCGAEAGEEAASPGDHGRKRYRWEGGHSSHKDRPRAHRNPGRRRWLGTAVDAGKCPWIYPQIYFKPRKTISPQWQTLSSEKERLRIVDKTRKWMSWCLLWGPRTGAFGIDAEDDNNTFSFLRWCFEYWPKDKALKCYWS